MADGLRDLDLADLARRQDLAGVEVDDAQLDAVGRQAGRVEAPARRDRRPGCAAITGSSLAP